MHFRKHFVKLWSKCYWNTGERYIHDSELGRGGHEKFHGGDEARLNFEDTFIK